LNDGGAAGAEGWNGGGVAGCWNEGAGGGGGEAYPWPGTGGVGPDENGAAAADENGCAAWPPDPATAAPQAAHAAAPAGTSFPHFQQIVPTENLLEAESRSAGSRPAVLNLYFPVSSHYTAHSCRQPEIILCAASGLRFMRCLSIYQHPETSRGLG
jgi:hypothetical protein